MTYHRTPNHRLVQRLMALSLSLLLGLGVAVLLLAVFSPAQSLQAAGLVARPLLDGNDVNVGITKTAAPSPVQAGSRLTYTVVVSNSGPQPANNVIVTDSLPAGVTLITATPSISCSGNSSSVVCSLGTLTVQEQVTVTLVVTAGNVLTTLVNAAQVTTSDSDNQAANNTVSISTQVTGTVDLQVGKWLQPPVLIAGGPITYTVIFTNASATLGVAGVGVTDTLPSAIENPSWSCANSPGATCVSVSGPTLSGTVYLPASGSVTFTVTGIVNAATRGVITNTAGIAPPSGSTDSSSSNNFKAVSSSLTTSVVLSITKAHAAENGAPGDWITYTIRVSNTGLSLAAGAVVSDSFPPEIAGVTWQCTAAAGASCQTPNGAGNITVGVTLPYNSLVTIVASGTVNAAATGGLTNTARISHAEDALPGGRVATDTIQLQPSVDLIITKTHQPAVVVPGAGLTYTLVVSNVGPSLAGGALVTDTFPLSFTVVGWTCTGSLGGVCATGIGSGNITGVPVTLPNASQVVFVITGTITNTALGSLDNSATASHAADPSPNSVTDPATLVPQYNLSLSKTDGVTATVPGWPVTYTVLVTNAGPSLARSVVISDLLSAQLTNGAWSCAPVGALGCTVAGGSGPAISAILTVPVGAQVRLTVTAQVTSGAAGWLTNTAEITGFGELTPGDNQQTDTDQLTPFAQLLITKTDNLTETFAGATVVYTIAVVNNGPSDVALTEVADSGPVGLSLLGWSCAATPGAVCHSAVAPGGYAFTDTVSLPAGGRLTYTVTTLVGRALIGIVTNTVSLNVPPELGLMPGSGLQATDVTRARARLFLPSVLRNFCAPIQHEHEPNNSFSNANQNGALCLNVTFLGQLEGAAGTVDLYRFDLPPGLVTFTVHPSSTADVQIVLYRESGANQVGTDPVPDGAGNFVIAHTVAEAGTTAYYLYVYAPVGSSNASPYTLIAVTAPAGAASQAADQAMQAVHHKRAPRLSIPPPPP